MDDLPVQPVDVAMGHHWTSTHPTTHFRSTLMCTRFGLDPDGGSTVTTLSLDGVSVRRPDRPTEHRDYSPDELPDVLTSLGAHLTDAEVTRLHDVVERLRSARVG